MDEWHVGAPVGFGETGQPEIPYMSYVKRVVDDKEEPTEEECRAEYDLDRRRRRCMTLSDESWRLYEENRPEEALVLINVALENFDTYENDWNRKGIYLDRLGRYGEALECFDKSLQIRADDVVRKNRADMILRWVRFEMHSRDELNHGLELIDSATDSLQKCKDDEGLLDELHELRREISNELFFGKGSRIQVIETPDAESQAPADFISELINSSEERPKDSKYVLMLLDKAMDSPFVLNDLQLLNKFHELRREIFNEVMKEDALDI
jgi:tetratricopeptide (TPR) repeat protein